MRKTTLSPGQLLRSVHMEKSYLGKAGCPGTKKYSCEQLTTAVKPCTEAKLTPGSVSCPGTMSCRGIM